MSCKIKICGLATAEDARQAGLLGVDAVGLVFYPPSPRHIEIEQAADIAAALPPFTTIVGLFVDAERSYIDDVLARVPLDVIQFHGSESDADCSRFGRRYFKALRMKPGLDVGTAIAAYPNASAILLDAYQAGLVGGTGKSFDWQRVPKQAAKPIILAGGLDSANVAEAIRQTNVYAVDVSGGVEASKGLKCHKKMAEFTAAVRSIS